MEDKGVQVNFNVADSNITESNDEEFLSDQISNLNISKFENKNQSEPFIDSDNLRINKCQLKIHCYLEKLKEFRNYFITKTR